MILPSEDNVAGLIAYLQGSDNSGRCSETDNAHRVAQMIDDPYFITSIKGHGDRLDPNHHRGLKLKLLIANLIYLKAISWRICNRQF